MNCFKKEIVTKIAKKICAYGCHVYCCTDTVQMYGETLSGARPELKKCFFYICLYRSENLITH